MKGNPLLRLGAVLLLLGALFWPVWKLTCRNSQHHPATPSATEISGTSPKTPLTAATLRATLILHAAPSPMHCSIRQQGVLLLSEKDMVSPGEYRTAVDLAKGVDLVIAADWPDEEPHAVRAEIYVHGYQAHLEKSFWAQRTLEDSFVLPDSFLP
jgi:hypothetical protein